MYVSILNPASAGFFCAHTRAMNRLSMSVTARAALAVLSMLLFSSCVVGASQAVASAKPVKSEKVDQVLIELHDQFIRHKETGGESEPFKGTNLQVRILDETVLVDAIASEGTVALENELRRLGATNLSSHGRVVSCYLPIASIDQLAAIESLQFVRASRPATRPARN